MHICTVTRRININGYFRLPYNLSADRLKGNDMHVHGPRFTTPNLCTQIKAGKVENFEWQNICGKAVELKKIGTENLVVEPSHSAPCNAECKNFRVYTLCYNFTPCTFSLSSVISNYPVWYLQYIHVQKCRQKYSSIKTTIKTNYHLRTGLNHFLFILFASSI